MSDMWNWPTRSANLDFSGSIPSDLDGLLLLPCVGQGRLHVIRLGGGRPLWYSSVLLDRLSQAPIFAAALRATTTRASDLEWLPSLMHAAPRESDERWIRTLPFHRSPRRLYVSRSAAELWHWRLCHEGGTVMDSGALATERIAAVVDVAVTMRHVLLMATADVPPDDAIHKLGIAVRRRRARVQWLHAERTSLPSFVHAHETEAQVLVDLSLAAPTASTASNLVRWTIDSDTLTYSTKPFSQQRLDWVAVGSTDEEGALRHLYGTATAPDGNSPALVRLDAISGARVTRELGFARQPGAPLPVGWGTPRSASYVIMTVYDAVRDCTDCLVLDAERIDGAPLATIRLPDAVRCDRHAQWADAATLEIA